MKAVYYYSAKQAAGCRSITAGGITYTEIDNTLFDSDPIPPHNNFPDSVIVRVEENLGINYLVYHHTGFPTAKPLLGHSDDLTFNQPWK